MADEKQVTDHAQPEASGPVDYGRYRMNPVQIEESSEAARPATHRVGVIVVLIALLAAAVLGTALWSKLAAGVPPLQSLDQTERDQAKELIRGLREQMSRGPLQGIVYDVQYPDATTLHIYIHPTINDASGGHPVTSGEIERVVTLVGESFKALASAKAKLEIRAFVADTPESADLRNPSALGVYDPDTDATTVTFSTHINLPERRGGAGGQ